MPSRSVGAHSALAALQLSIVVAYVSTSARSLSFADVIGRFPYFALVILGFKEVVAADDAKYASRRFELRADVGLIRSLRDKVLPPRPAKIIYVESHSHALREFEGTLELPELEEQVAATMTGKPLCLRVITTGGTRTVESRRVVRLYL